MSRSFAGSQQTRQTVTSSRQGRVTETREEELLVKLFMLSIEIDRKDDIIRELLELVNHGKQEQIEQLNSRCQNYEIEIKSLKETNHMLQDSITVIENSKKNEIVYNSMHQFNNELEDKLQQLQGRLKKSEEQRIEVTEEFKAFKVTQSMGEFKIKEAVNVEKARVRELENQLISEKSKVDIERGKLEHEKRLMVERNQLIDELKEKMHVMGSNEIFMRQQYEEEIVRMRNETQMNENLKKSQINNNQEKMALISQQIERLREDNRNLRQTIDQLRGNLGQQTQDLEIKVTEYRNIEARLTMTENEWRKKVNQLEARIQDMKFREKEQINERQMVERKIKTDIDEKNFILGNVQQQAQMFAQEAQRLKLELNEYSLQLDEQRAEIRKLKRKPVTGVVVCEGCRAREAQSASMIGSHHNLGGVDMTDIISQTEQLIRSNIHMESLINKHETILESSIQVYRTHTYHE